MSTDPGRLTRTALPMAWLLMLAVGCGGGGDTDGGGDTTPTPTKLAYGVGGPDAALSQQPLALTLSGATSGAAAGTNGVRPRSPAGDHVFGFPAGPDAQGDALPKVSGDFDALSRTWTQGLSTRLWIDLPASAGAHPVALEVTRVLEPDATFSSRDPVSGEILVTRRVATAEFGGRLRLAFGTGETPVCLGWDAARDGVFEVERCVTPDALRALWDMPDDTLAIPATVQRAAGATFEAWRRFQLQFEFAVGALRTATAQASALGAAAAGADAATVTCGVYPPTGRTGRYTLSWLDRNGSGRFDDGDDVRFVASECWQRLDEGTGGPGRLFDGTLELRAYRRGVGAAPTFIGLHSTDTVDIGGVVTPQDGLRIDGGFVLRVPELDSEVSQVGAYPFDEGNMLAAGGTAARSIEVYRDLSSFASRALQAVVTQPAARQLDLGMCRNGGSSIVQRDEAVGQPEGLSAGDPVVLMFIGCDIGSAEQPKVMDGNAEFRLASVEIATPPGTDWRIDANLRMDLRHATAAGSARRIGELGVSTGFVLGHSYLVNYRATTYTSAQPISGVVAAYRDGALDFQIGCTSASSFHGNWADATYAIDPAHVVKTAQRVFTIGIRQGEPFVFGVGAQGRYEPQTGLAGLQPISAPECTALGVPATGVTGGVNRMEFDAGPAGDGGRVRLVLARESTVLKEIWTDWAALAR